jgi:hypothetical protein
VTPAQGHYTKDDSKECRRADASERVEAPHRCIVGSLLGRSDGGTSIEKRCPPRAAKSELQKETGRYAYPRRSWRR